MWELDHEEGWVPKNWCFRTAVLGRFLKVPWIARRSNQSILKEINPEYLLEGLMLKLQCFGYLMQTAKSLEKILMRGKTDGRSRSGWQRIRCLDGSTDSMDVSFSKLREVVKDREGWHAVVHGVAKSWTQFNCWTTICYIPTIFFINLKEFVFSLLDCLRI